MPRCPKTWTNMEIPCDLVPKLGTCGSNIFILSWSYCSQMINLRVVNNGRIALTKILHVTSLRLLILNKCIKFLSFPYNMWLYWHLFGTKFEKKHYLLCYLCLSETQLPYGALACVAFIYLSNPLFCLSRKLLQSTMINKDLLARNICNLSHEDNIRCNSNIKHYLGHSVIQSPHYALIMKQMSNWRP